MFRKFDHGDVVQFIAIMVLLVPATFGGMLGMFMLVAAYPWMFVGLIVLGFLALQAYAWIDWRKLLQKE
jgi:hypothetical protein